MIDEKRFTAAELYKVLEREHTLKFKGWQRSVSPLANEIDFLNSIIPFYQDQVENWKNRDMRYFYNRAEFEFVDMDVPINWQKRLEIAKNRLRELQEGKKPLFPEHIIPNTENVRFKEWFENLYTTYDIGKGDFLEKELQLCNEYLQTQGDGIYNKELYQVLSNEYEIISKISRKIQNENIANTEAMDDLYIEQHTNYVVPTVDKETKATQAPTNLKDLFIKPELWEGCLQLLKEAEPPIITEENRFIGKNKGDLVVWLNTIESKGLLNQSIKNDVGRAKLLIHTFTHLKISGDLFRADNIRAKENYAKHFSIEISVLKHSQH